MARIPLGQITGILRWEEVRRMDEPREREAREVERQTERDDTTREQPPTQGEKSDRGATEKERAEA